MDQELLTYLKEQFHEIRQRFVGVDERFGKMDERFGKMDERFVEMEGQICGLREESREGIRHTQILVEDVRDNVRLLAEGMASVDERMGRLEVDLNRKLNELWTLVVNPVQGLEQRVTHLEEVENRRHRDIIEVIRERYGMPRDS